MDRVELIAGLDPSLLEQVVAQLLDLEPSTTAIVVTGSYAKGTADADSDLDLRAATAGEPIVDYRSWFEERPGADPLHVSASAMSIAAWLAWRTEPQRWALGFPAFYDAQYVWATAEARAHLGDPPTNVHPPGPALLEEFVEFLVKLRRAAGLSDGAGLRLFAHEAAVLAPGLLRPLNDEITVRDRREALEAAISLPIAPENYRHDLAVSLGLVPADDDVVAESALRLGRELLAFLRERKPDVDPMPDIARYLADGTLERHLGF